ncbi:PAS domain S-box protein, partial [candidate division KSB1 bacterium]|nr:PAS domain S-box protein [candidate division KSB1 bacterium]NIT72045.1 PAS domain S-box protein [candidate division KSB1 bacterium]NIX71725.1 PAS domain S-box protein [candidate division KSB1 bacterium]
MTRDTNTQRFRDRLLLRPKFIVAVTLTLASILVVSAVVELYQMKKEIRHIMSEEASSLIEAIAVSSDNATLAYSEIEHQMAERLLNNARLIARMSQQRQLSQNDLAEIAQDNSLYRINLFDENGRKVLSSHTPDHTNSTELNRQEDFIRPLLTEQTDDLVIGFKDSRYGRGKRYAVAVERPGGGAVVVNIDADEMLQLRKDIGVGTLINDIAEREGIEYVAIQDTLGIIAASQNVTSLSKLKNDPFLIQAVDNKTPSTRMSEFDGRQTFEVAAPFIIDGVSVGLFRIGLKSDHLIEANARTKRRLALITVILLAGGVLVFNFIIVNQNYKLLDEAYLRTKTYTGKILENMADAVVAINRDQKITLFNQAAELFFGVTAKDAIGKSCSELIRSESILEKTLRSGRGVTDVETQYNLPEKRAIISISTFALQEKNGEVDSAVAVIKDLTERRAMEET